MAVQVTHRETAPQAAAPKDAVSHVADAARVRRLETCIGMLREVAEGFGMYLHADVPAVGAPLA